MTQPAETPTTPTLPDDGMNWIGTHGDGFTLWRRDYFNGRGDHGQIIGWINRDERGAYVTFEEYGGGYGEEVGTDSDPAKALETLWELRHTR